VTVLTVVLESEIYSEFPLTLFVFASVVLKCTNYTFSGSKR